MKNRTTTRKSASIIERQPFRDALKKAGWMLDPVEYVGMKYLFEAEYGLHNATLLGQITAIGLTDGGRLELYVTNPTLGDYKLVSFRLTEGGEWQAVVELADAAGGKRSAVSIGSLTLLG